MSSDAEVIVVGGGPAGAATAARLAAAGRDVLVLERARFPREKACAEYLSPGVVAALDRLGALAGVRAAGVAWAPGIRIHARGAEFLVAYGGRLALGARRPLLDAALLEHARAAGARVARTSVAGALVERGRVVGVHLRDGRVHRARLVVGADGLHSAVARSLGLVRDARWPRRLGLVARYRLAHPLDVAEMHVGERAYCGVAPVGDGLATVGFAAPLAAKGVSASSFERAALALPGIRRVLAGADREGPVRGAAPLARRVARAAGPGFLLVGDAAGFLDPFSGEGVHRALRGAELAADAADDALRRPEALAAGYEGARRRAFADKERLCLLVQAALASPRAFRYALARAGRRPQTAALLGEVFGDLRPAADALRPRLLLSVLAP